jgi:hypothetical protein
MGGFGSGRPSDSGRDKVEYSRSIDINRLHKAGCLAPGWPALTNNLINSRIKKERAGWETLV